METDANPVLLQTGDSFRVPLFLIHDGSGTIHSYHNIRPLGRPVYAIHNPWFQNKTKWKGGILAFAKMYIKLIESVYPQGDILVGGWSIGGIIGIEIGRMLAQNNHSKLRVAGVVMIDAVFMHSGPPGTRHAEPDIDTIRALWPSDAKLQEQVLRCIWWAQEDGTEWADVNVKTGAAEGEKRGLEGALIGQQPPPAVLLMGTRNLPVQDKSSGAVAFIDYRRHDRLGWNLFAHDFIIAQWELPAHHSGVFEKTVIEETSEQVSRACDLLAED